MSELWTNYQHALTEKSLLPDPEQEKAVRALDQVLNHLVQPQKKRFGIFKAPKNTKGLYLYGPVGRGKTMLMDLFLQQLKNRHITVERWHFHAFMLKIHQDLRDLSEQTRDLDNRIGILADMWLKRTKVMCFDEFHVTDVADAMIMMPFFTTLFDKGMVLLTTSNWAPSDLYSGGLQRSRFLPFIDTLTRHMHVVNVSGATDYRTRQQQKTPSWLTPLNEDSAVAFDTLFRQAVGYDPIETHEIHVGRKTDSTAQENSPHASGGGRTWVIPFASKNTAKINLDQFLSEPLGAADFIALAERYPLLFLDELRCFTTDTNNKAKRFMVMIDVLYDHGVKLAVRADDIAEKLYPESGNLYFEFTRTVSRLKEMTQITQEAA